MHLDHTVISIGTLSRNPLWAESAPRRSAHATCTLFRQDEINVLIDPGLPPELIAQRLDERCGLEPAKVAMVFLTCFRPVHRRGLAAFDSARWLMHEPEIEAVAAHLKEMADRAADAGQRDVLELVRQEQALLRRIRPAPEKLTSHIHLFPTPGVTPGAAGLLLAMQARTVIAAGDAVLTRDHLQSGRVYEQSSDVDAAAEALAEIAGLADEIIPGHDNLFTVAGR